MTNLIEIKPYIHDYIEENLDSVFSNKVYWLGERKNIPTYPYCLLNIIAENKDKRTSHYGGDLVKVLESGQIDLKTYREGVIQQYKTCTITVGIYNAWVEDTYSSVDMDVAKEFTYEQINYLEGMFEFYPINKMFSVQNITPIRPLHEVVDGGYMYRYEFDLTIGYNETKAINREIGKSVEVDIEENGETAVDFIVTIDNNDNIIVET